MADVTTIAALPWPELEDAPNIEDAVRPLAEALDNKIVPRFATTTERDAVITAPVFGMVCTVVGNGLMFYNGAVWRTQAVPAMVGAASAATNSIPSTTMAALPNPISTSITIPAELYVYVQLSGWVAAETEGLRAGVNITGATTLGPTVGQGVGNTDGTDSTWGDVIRLDGASCCCMAMKYVKLSAGTTTFTVQAHREGTVATPSFSYPVLRVMPHRWVL